jgi:hypothetical protein
MALKQRLSAPDESGLLSRFSRVLFQSAASALPPEVAGGPALHDCNCGVCCPHASPRRAHPV